MIDKATAAVNGMSFDDVHLCVAMLILALAVACVVWVGWYDTKEGRQRKAFEQEQRDRFKGLLPPDQD